MSKLKVLFWRFFEQPINNLTILYARGGLSQFKVKERYELGAIGDNRQFSGTNPYIGIGTKVQSSIDKSLALTMELSYYPLEQDYSSLSFTVGGQYRFKRHLDSIFDRLRPRFAIYHFRFMKLTLRKSC